MLSCFALAALLPQKHPGTVLRPNGGQICGYRKRFQPREITGSHLAIHKEIPNVASRSVGSFPEGVAFSQDNAYIYVGNFASSTLSILGLKMDGKVDLVKDMKLSGPPASMRVSGQ